MISNGIALRQTCTNRAIQEIELLIDDGKEEVPIKYSPTFNFSTVVCRMEALVPRNLIRHNANIAFDVLGISITLVTATSVLKTKRFQATNLKVLAMHNLYIICQ